MTPAGYPQENSTQADTENTEDIGYVKRKISQFQELADEQKEKEERNKPLKPFRKVKSVATMENAYLHKVWGSDFSH